MIRRLVLTLLAACLAALATIAAERVAADEVPASEACTEPISPRPDDFLRRNPDLVHNIDEQEMRWSFLRSVMASLSPNEQRCWALRQIGGATTSGALGAANSGMGSYRRPRPVGQTLGEAAATSSDPRSVSDVLPDLGVDTLLSLALCDDCGPASMDLLALLRQPGRPGAAA